MHYNLGFRQCLQWFEEDTDISEVDDRNDDDVIYSPEEFSPILRESHFELLCDGSNYIEAMI